jgi:hypothetical protein
VHISTRLFVHSGTGLCGVIVTYQLVLQYSGDSANDLELMSKVEDELIDSMSDTHAVDGHDIGNGKINIYVITHDPHGILQVAVPILERHKVSRNIIAAYRPVEGDQYEVIWPAGSASKFDVS